MALILENPSYATLGPSKSYQVLAPNEQSNLEVAFAGRAVVVLDGSATTGTINFIDGTNAIFATGTANAYPNQGLSPVVAPAAVVCDVIGAAGANAAANNALSVNAGTPTTTGFPIYLSAHGTTSTYNSTAAITSWSITNGVLTINSAALGGAIATGATFFINGLANGSFLNGVPLVALSGGTTTLTTASFTLPTNPTNPGIVYPSSATEPGLLIAPYGTITSWAISSNVATFTSSAMANALAAGTVFYVGGLTAGSYMTGLQFVANAGGTTTSTAANFTHANASATEGGSIASLPDTITIQFSVYRK